MEEIIRYFVDEKKTTEAVAKVLAKTLMKYEDIQNEFLFWVKNKQYLTDGAIEIEGYTAQAIHELVPYLDGAGIYNFMVTLRDNPQKAHDYIKNGFPTK